MKQNIEIQKDEILAISLLIEDKFNKDSESPLKVNSNPANYEKLNVDIFSKTQVNVGKRFLCKFLFESTVTQDTTMTFRSERIEALYMYISGVSRQDYLRSHSIHPHKVIFVSTNGQVEEIDEFRKIASNNLNISLEPADFSNIGDMEPSYFWSIINTHTTKFLICINEGILKNIDGMQLLSELLLKYISRLVIDSSIKFLFSSNLFNDASLNITKYSGRLGITEYWQKELNEIIEIINRKEIPKSIKDELITEEKKVKKIIGDSYRILQALAEIYKLNWNGNKIQYSKTLDEIQPITKIISGCEVRKLNEVISDLENEKRRDLLCVISYEKYFHTSEIEEMVKYFQEFYGKLGSKHNIYRVFCIKGKKNNRGKFYSLLSREENINVYEYLTLSRGANARSYLLIYDESPWLFYDTPILYEQDYILSLPTNEFNYSPDESIEKAINHLPDDDIPKTKLYLTYPEDERGTNRMIELKMNYAAIRQWILDFNFRIQSSIESPNHIRLEFAKQQDEIQQYLNYYDEQSDTKN